MSLPLVEFFFFVYYVSSLMLIQGENEGGMTLILYENVLSAYS